MSTSSLQWVVSAYVLGYGGFLLLGGRAADLLGRRRVFLISLGVFVVASLLGGLANDGTLLIATRFIKGVSAAFTAPAGALDHHHDLRARARRATRRSRSTPRPARPGFSLGLVIGGLLTEIGWRWVFFLPAPVALVTLLAGVAPRAARPPGRRAVARVRRRRRGQHDGGDAAARLHARRGARRRLGSRPARSARSSRVAAILAAFVARERTRADAARPARHPALGLARAREPRRDVAVRRLGRLPVHR